MEHQRIPFEELKIDRQEIYRTMGYRNEIPEREFQEMIEEMLQGLSQLCNPRGIFRIYEGQLTGSGRLEIGQTSFRVGKIIAPCLQEAQQFAV